MSPASTMPWKGLTECALISWANLSALKGSRWKRGPSRAFSERLRVSSSMPQSKNVTSMPPWIHFLCWISPFISSYTGSAVPRPLSSTFTTIQPCRAEKTSLRVGILSPSPASRALSSPRVISPTRSEPSVVLSTVSSWITTSSPDAHRWTSSSVISAFSWTALMKDRSVFSGSWPAAPLWPILRTMDRKGFVH